MTTSKIQLIDYVICCMLSCNLSARAKFCFFVVSADMKRFFDISAFKKSEKKFKFWQKVCHFAVKQTISFVNAERRGFRILQNMNRTNIQGTRYSMKHSCFQFRAKSISFRTECEFPVNKIERFSS